MTMYGIETLEIQLVNEGMPLGKSILFGYVNAAFGGGGGSVDKCKFVARVISPNHYDFDSESFLQRITRQSFDHRGLLIEAPQSDQTVLNAWNRLRGRILSRGWHEVKTTDSNWYRRYSYWRPVGTGATYNRSRTERNSLGSAPSARKTHRRRSSSKLLTFVVTFFIIAVLTIGGLYTYYLWHSGYYDFFKEPTSECVRFLGICLQSLFEKLRVV
jgi:hypothetical protein